MVQCAIAQHLFPSDHSTANGQAELNSFPVHCSNDCYFTMFLEVKKLDFESESESGAMYRVWNKERDKFILFGIDANKRRGEPQISIVSSENSKKMILGSSSLGLFEGFRFEWKDGYFHLKNLRNVKREGYSILQESGISYHGKLDFEPHSIEYLFLGVDVKQYVDATSQNINSKLKSLVNGS